jgi:Fe2+ or Zn2+ uptake regulation protein
VEPATSFTKKNLSLEDAVSAILREFASGEDPAAPLSIQTIYSILQRKGIKTTQESLRKVLERLESKGLVKRIGKGMYIYSREHITLDLFLEPKAEHTLIRLWEIQDLAAAHLELLKHVKNKIEIKDIDNFNNLIIGGAAVDDGSRLISSMASFGLGFVRVSARIRIACILPFNIDTSTGFPRLIPQMDKIDYYPEHIMRGGTAEFLVERFKKPYLEKSYVIRSNGIDYEIASKVAKKLSEYDLVEFNMNMINQAVSRAEHKASSCDVALTLVDGSILPGHLDPDIHPNSEKIEKIKEESTYLAKLLLERKRNILQGFLSIYERVLNSENVILIGAIKRSNDETLQAKARIHYGVPDQRLLRNAGLEKVILGPFEKHRVVKVLSNQLEAFSLVPRGEIKIKSYYIMWRRDALPLQIDALFPKNLDEDNSIEAKILKLLYDLTEVSTKHTYIKENWEGSDDIIPTLRPIAIVDEIIGKKVAEISEIIEKELSLKLSDVLLYLANTVKGEFTLFTYVPSLGSLVEVKQK